MTNLEYYKDEIVEYCSLCTIARICKYGKNCYGIDCKDCEFHRANDKYLEIILAEHKEPIKLKQWEKDLLEIIDYQETRFDFYNDLRNMKKRGYFEGVTDTNMGIKEILDNCEVEDR